MRENVGTALLILGSAVVFFLALEGVYSLVQDEPTLSLTRRFLAQHRPVHAYTGELAPYLTDRRQIEEQLPAFQANGVVLANSPYKRLASAEARTTVDDPVLGHRLKPNLVVRSSHLHSRLFDSLDPLAYSYIQRDGAPLDPEVADFLARHAFLEIPWTTDEDGLRTTLPRVDAEKVVLLVGSSPCASPFVKDEETLASVLQRRQMDLRFVNACLPGTKVWNHAAQTERMLERFGDRVVGLIYTINEKNFGDGDAVRFGEVGLANALEALDRIAGQLDAVGADYRVLIYHYYIWETMPDLFRANTHLEESFANRRAILARARELGFTIVDTFEMVHDYSLSQGSLFAGMALYVDHGHLSREGNQVLAREILPVPAQAPGPGPAY